METEGLHITKLSLPMELSSANQAEGLVRGWGERSGLKGRLLFHLVFVANEVVAAIIRLSKVAGVKGDIEIEVHAYTRHIIVNITFPDSIPLDPTFDHCHEILNEFPGLKLEPDIFWHHALLKWVDEATWSKSWKRKKRTISLIQYARAEEKAGELYFLSLMPKPAEDLKLGFVSKGEVVAKTPRMETALHLGSRASFVLNSVNGKTSVREIYYSFVEEFGLIHPQTLGSLIEHFIDKGLIVPDDPLRDFQQEKASKIKRILNRILRLRYSIPNADAFTETINQKIGWLWSVRAWYLYLFFVLGSIIFFSSRLSSVEALAVEYFDRRLLLQPWIWIGFYLGISIMIIIHEFSHAIVCKRYGGRVYEMGVMLYYAAPCAFTDTTDAWMFKNKWHRVMVSLAGPFNTMTLACFFGWGWVLSMHWGIQILSHIFGAFFLVGILQAFINLIPFIESDGYYILMDILEMPNLRRKSFSYLSSLAGSLFKAKPKPQVPKRETIVHLVYALLAITSIILMLLFLLHFIKLEFSKLPGILSWILASILVVIFFDRAIRAGIKWYERTHLATVDLKVGAWEK